MRRRREISRPHPMRRGDSISLHWNTSPQLPAGSCLRARQPAETRHGTGSANLLHQHPTPRPRRIRKPDREQSARESGSRPSTQPPPWMNIKTISRHSSRNLWRTSSTVMAKVRFFPSGVARPIRRRRNATKSSQFKKLAPTESPTAIEVVVRPWSEGETFRLHFRLPVLA